MTTITALRPPPLEPGEVGHGVQHRHRGHSGIPDTPDTAGIPDTADDTAADVAPEGSIAPEAADTGGTTDAGDSDKE